MDESDKMLKATQFVCEATSYETHMLWEKFSTESMYKTELNKYQWTQHSPGYLITTGEFYDYPVNISCQWFSINGVLVMFYEAVSRVIDQDMIDTWLKKNCNPQWNNGTRRAHTNAGNFHHALNYIDSTTAKHQPAVQ